MTIKLINKALALLSLVALIEGLSGSSESHFGRWKMPLPLDWLDMDKISSLLEEGRKVETQDSVYGYGPFYEEDDSVVPLVTVPDLGTARGRVLNALFGTEFFAFHSIPYANPPVGDLRFRMPEPWNGSWPTDYNDEQYDATFLRAKCPQASMAVSVAGGREDCLHISIYTPNTIMDSNTKYPVMFFIHGGAFVSGDASLYIPTKLMDKEVVVVMVQYRLGTLGFLSSGTPDNPGNMGLGDQIMALRWVRDYISYFGGDPNLVTVFGQSAGSASTSWLLFTPLTNADNNNGEALFHRAITESGCALDAWAHDPTPQESFELEADTVGCWTNDSTVEDALACMRELPFQDIVDGFLSVYAGDRKVGGLGFKGVSPVIQTDLALNYPDEVAADPDLLVISEHPLRSVEKGEFLHVPVMSGSVRDEGSLVFGLIYEDFLVPNNLSDNEFFIADASVPFLLHSFGIVDLTGAAANSMKIAFLEGTEMGNIESMSGGMVDLSGMLFLKSGMWSLVQLMKYNDPTGDFFFYSFEFESDDSIFPWYFLSDPEIPIDGGITHVDDLLYLFYLPSLMDESQQITVRRLTKLWTNFAKYGNPTPSEAVGDEVWEGDVPLWTPFTIESLDFMLMEDEFTISSDFTLRWNHNKIQQNCSESSLYKMEVSMREAAEANAEAVEDDLNGWKIGVGALGAACLLLVMSLIFVLLRFKR